MSHYLHRFVKEPAMTCYSLDGLTPVVDPSAYVHPSAVLIGDVIVGPHCYVGPLASLRRHECSCDG